MVNKYLVSPAVLFSLSCMATQPSNVVSLPDTSSKAAPSEQSVVLGETAEELAPDTAKQTLETAMTAKDGKKFEVSGVVVKNFTGVVLVKTTNEDKTVNVSIKGPDNLLDRIQITDKHTLHTGELFVGFESTIPTLVDVDKLVLNLEVPSKMPLSISLTGGRGNVDIREADTTFSINGGGDITSSKVKNLFSTIDGSGEIIINQIDGNADIDIRGDGKYIIRKGTIPNLKAGIRGTGIIDVKAVVGDADLKCEGAGTMNLAVIKGELKQTKNAAGVIRISKMPRAVKTKQSQAKMQDKNSAQQQKLKKAES
ncbi:MAG: hypothetical protein FJX03_06875 [Alphaproteobacteria bacterium]|nr:hypothetical protein [Alphaproteobacteria bacterium]